MFRLIYSHHQVEYKNKERKYSQLQGFKISSITGKVYCHIKMRNSEIQS
jgi:hypothetical protein